MPNKIILYFLVFLLQLCHSSILGQGVKGIIQNTRGEVVPYASVYVPAIHKGTTANEEGAFQLPLDAGEYELLVQYLGYQTFTIRITVDAQYVELNITMSEQRFTLPEVIITSSGEDPAYFIMRKAIGMSQYYRNQVSVYSARVYLKGTGVPEKIPALMRRQLKRDGIEEGKYFVTETISEIEYKKDEPIKTNVISLRSSEIGSENSPMQFVTLSLYDDIDGIISPLSLNAFQVYRFRLEGTFMEDGRTINKIRIIPRRKGHDLYSGTIYIREGSWNIHSVDLLVEQRMLTVKIRQVYQAVDQLVWMPVSHDYDVYFSAMGAAFSFRYLVSVNNYSVSLNPDIDHAFYASLIDLETYDDLPSLPLPDQEITISEDEEKISDHQNRMAELLESQELSNREMRELNKLIRMDATATRERPPLEMKPRHTEIADSALLREPAYWQQNRPVPLTVNELESFNEPVNDTAASDTLSKKRKIFNEILMGTSNRKLSENWTLQHNGLLGLSSFDYNTVDGLLITKKIGFRHQPENGRQLRMKSDFSYAFARTRFNANGEIDFLYGTMSRSRVVVSGGRTTSDFNYESGILPFFNTVTTLYTRQNFMKLFEKDYFRLSHQNDLANGLVLHASAEFANRRQLDNHASFYLTNFLGKSFTPNLPPPILGLPELAADHKAFIFDVTISYTPRYFYRIANNRKLMLYSSYPTFSVRWRQGMPDVLDGATAFQHIEFGIKHGFEKRLIGRFDYVLKTGFFPDYDKLYFTDFKHFNNNPLWISSSSNKLEHFRGLDFYNFSTKNAYFESHFQYNHGRILLKRLPFLASSLIRESIFINSLIVEHNKPYLELGYGVNQVFLVFDVEVFTGFIGGRHHQTGIRLGVPFGEGSIRF